jgi:hypothetical protein
VGHGQDASGVGIYDPRIPVATEVVEPHLPPFVVWKTTLSFPSAGRIVNTMTPSNPVCRGTVQGKLGSAARTAAQQVKGSTSRIGVTPRRRVRRRVR